MTVVVGREDESAKTEDETRRPPPRGETPPHGLCHETGTFRAPATCGEPGFQTRARDHRILIAGDRPSRAPPALRLSLSLPSFIVTGNGPLSGPHLVPLPRLVC